MWTRARTALTAVLSALTVVLATAGAAAAAVTGPDVSSWQHPSNASIDWPAVAASGQSFTWIKATEGTTYTNPYFTGDWTGSAAAGLMHGAYHYARPSGAASSAADQARRFAAVIGDQTRPGTLPPALDMEESGGLTPAQLVAWTHDFLTTLQSLTGRTPVIYTYPYFWQHQMGGSSAFHQYPLWIASYGASQPTTLGWPTWTFWQFSATSSLPGVASKGTLDMNRFNGSSSDLARLALTSASGSDPDPTGVTSPGATSTPDPGSPPARYTPLTPTRIADTRTGQGVQPGRVTGAARTVTVPGTVPASAAGVVLNVSVVDPSSDGFLRVAAAGQAPLDTAVNFVAGQSFTGLVDTRMSPSHQVTLTMYGGPADLVVDLVGYYDSAAGTGGHWTPATQRFVDGRSGLGVPGGPSQGAVTITLPATVPADARGAVLNLSVVDPSGDGYVRVGAPGQALGTTAMNFSRGVSLTGLVVTQGDADRQITVHVVGGPAYLVVDLVGYYDAGSSAGDSYVAMTPQRFLDTRQSVGPVGGGRSVTVSLPASVPAGAQGAVFNLSVVNPSGTGWVRVAPAGAPADVTALNFTRGQSQTVLAVSGLSAGRQVTITVYGGAADVVADLVGYHAAATS